MAAEIENDLVATLGGSKQRSHLVADVANGCPLIENERRLHIAVLGKNGMNGLCIIVTDVQVVASTRIVRDAHANDIRPCLHQDGTDKKQGGQYIFAYNHLCNHINIGIIRIVGHIWSHFGIVEKSCL